MSIDEYIGVLEAKFRDMESLVTAISFHREIDANLGIGFIKGSIAFVDGSRLEFSEQLPVERQKYRFHYMDSRNQLIVRWDSSPHHQGIATYPFHRRTPDAVEEHGAITLVQALEQVVKTLQI